MIVYQTNSGLGYNELRYLIQVKDDNYLCIGENIKSSTESELNEISIYSKEEIELVQYPTVCNTVNKIAELYTQPEYNMNFSQALGYMREKLGNVICPENDPYRIFYQEGYWQDTFTKYYGEVKVLRWESFVENYKHIMFKKIIR